MEINITKEHDSVIPINSIVKSIDTVQEPLKTLESQIDIRKNNSRHKPLTRTLFVKNKVETYSMDEICKIDYARKHRNANRPIHLIAEGLNDNVNFCHCCDLPCEEKGIIEPFNICDDADKFAECGLGISLYFFFFWVRNVYFYLRFTMFIYCFNDIKCSLFFGNKRSL